MSHLNEELGLGYLLLQKLVPTAVHLIPEKCVQFRLNREEHQMFTQQTDITRIFNAIAS